MGGLNVCLAARRRLWVLLSCTGGARISRRLSLSCVACVAHCGSMGNITVCVVCRGGRAQRVPQILTALSLHFSATKCSGTSVVPGCTQCIAVHAQKKKNWPACSLFRMPGRNKRRLCGSHSGAGAFDILESLSERDTENAPETAHMCSPGMCVPQRAHVQYSPGERAFVLCGVSLLINIFTLQSMFLQFGRYACLSLTARNAVEPHVLYFLFYFR
ncbi:hypothetical protein B0H13DRAFT_70797 [Mycena leptocephala]|nr:hypothetical protein B0H13DRAFT_70797 [Mycena leptocephala]